MIKNSHRSWSYLLLIVSSVLIVTATISPFNFVTIDDLSIGLIIDRFRGSTNIKDYVRNILLFLSFGFAWGKILSYKKYQRWQVLILSFLFSAIFSSSIELIQILLPSRTSSFSDIICNALGGLLGASIYCWHKYFFRLINGIITRNYQQINLGFLATIIFSYCATISCGWILLINSINLNNWNNNAHLAIASEVTGQTFWRGYITSLYICDRAIAPSETPEAFKDTHSFFSQSPNLVTSFLFSDYQSSYSDNNQQIPSLYWQKELSPKKTNSLLDNSVDNSTINYQIHHNKTVLFDNKNSLISASPATQLNKKIKAAQEFTLNIILATDKLKQVGPSRIISLGENIYSRNLMLGQEGADLVFRLRTPTTGKNATQPGFYIPNFFKDTDLHQILITYAQNKLTFYLDNSSNPYTFYFQPSTHLKLFTPWIFEQWNVNLKDYNLVQARIFFYSLVFFPLMVLNYVFLMKVFNPDKKK